MRFPVNQKEERAQNRSLWCTQRDYKQNKIKDVIAILTLSLFLTEVIIILHRI